jgi:hypothetical protein
MKKIKLQRIRILFAICILTLSSCSETNICGPIENTSNKIEFHICEDILKKDTLDSKWFEKLNEKYSSNEWLEDFDTIAFFLPDGYEIIEASQSFLLIPSIWAKYGDEVDMQFFLFYNLQMHCKNPNFKMNNNMLIKGFGNIGKLSNELYFKNKKNIDKNELLTELKKYYDASALEISELSEDDSTKKKYLIDNQRAKSIWEGYLNNYINWETASSRQWDGGEQLESFGLLKEAIFLTLTIKNEESTDKITIVYRPTYGN